ncbi:MAG: Rho termination factor N-terminal domain-containing protein [Candidatus Thorarchaeota archaeon]
MTDYSKMNLKQLKEIAKERDIIGYSTYKSNQKAELIQLIKETPIPKDIPYSEWRDLHNSRNIEGIINIILKTGIDKKGITYLQSPNGNYMVLRVGYSNTLQFVPNTYSDDDPLWKTKYTYKKPKYFMSIPKLRWLKKRRIPIKKFWKYLEDINAKTNQTYEELEILVRHFQKGTIPKKEMVKEKKELMEDKVKEYKNKKEIERLLKEIDELRNRLKEIRHKRGEIYERGRKSIRAMIKRHKHTLLKEYNIRAN